MDVPDRLQRAWWSALNSSRWSLPCEWRHKLMLYHQTKLIAPKRLLHEVCSPAETVKVLEHLVQERRLTRQQATQLEERILYYVNKKGGWYGGHEGAGTT